MICCVETDFLSIRRWKVNRSHVGISVLKKTALAWHVNTTVQFFVDGRKRCKWFILTWLPSVWFNFPFFERCTAGATPVPPLLSLNATKAQQTNNSPIYLIKKYFWWRFFILFIYSGSLFSKNVVLGDYFWRTWHPTQWHLPRWVRITTGAHQRLLQRSEWRQVRPPRRLGRFGARHYGLCAFWAIRTTFPTGQLCIRSERSRQQLGQRSLHRGRRAGWLCFGRGAQRSRKLRLPARFPVDSLIGRRNWLRHGNTAHFQNPRRIPWSYHEHLFRGAVTQSVGHSCRAL